MTTLFALVRVMLAVLWFSTSVCAAECAGIVSPEASETVLSSQGDTGQTHCSAHCEDRLSAVSKHRIEKASVDLPDVGVEAAVTALSSAPISIRAPPALFERAHLRDGLHDLRTVRLMI